METTKVIFTQSDCRDLRREITISKSKNGTVLKLKELFAERLGYDVSELFVRYGRRPILDDETIHFDEIEDKSSYCVTFRLRGGGSEISSLIFNDLSQTV